MLHGRLVWLEWGRGLKVGLDSIRSENLDLDLQFKDQDLDLFLLDLHVFHCLPPYSI